MGEVISNPIDRLARWWVSRHYKPKPVVYEKQNGNIKRIEELIGQLEQIQDELVESEKSFEALVLLTSSWVWKTDVNGNYSYVSPRAYSLYRYTAEQLMGHRPYEFVDPEQVEQVKAISDYLLASHESVKDYPAKSFDAVGNVVYTKTSCVPIFSKEGEYRGHLGKEEIISLSEYELLRARFNK